MGVAVITFGNLSDKGRVRQRNEDFYGAFGEEGDDWRLFVVADGMGGHQSGDVASRLAVKTFWDTFRAGPSEPCAAVLSQAVQAVNEAIYREGGAADVERRMGTTFTALLLRDARAYLAHVGDSRAYLIRGRSIQQLTRDHSRVAELVRKGLLSEDEAETHPEAHVILRALGLEEHVDVDAGGPVPLERDDVLVLATDGLTRLVRADEIRRVCRSFAPQEACGRLVALANERGGPDNITVQVIRFSSPGRAHALATLATVITAICLTGGGALWWRATETRPSASAAQQSLAASSGAPAIPRRLAAPPTALTSRVSALARQLRPIGHLEDPRALAVSPDGRVIALDGSAALLGRSSEPGEAAFEPVALEQADRRGARWIHVTFSADGQAYGVVQDGVDGSVRLAAIGPDGIIARPLLRVVGGAGERRSSRSLLARIFGAFERDTPPVLRAEPPSAMAFAIGRNAVIYAQAANRLLRLREGNVALLTRAGFAPALESRAPLDVRAVLGIADGDLPIVARPEGADLAVEALLPDRPTWSVRVSAHEGEVLGAAAAASADRVVLMFPGHLRIVQPSPSGRFVDLVPLAAGDRAVSIAVRYRMEDRVIERRLQADEGWRLATLPHPTAHRDAGAASTSGISSDGHWWVFALGGDVYRLHLTEALEKIWTWAGPSFERLAPADGRRTRNP